MAGWPATRWLSIGLGCSLEHCNADWAPDAVVLLQPQLGLRLCSSAWPMHGREPLPHMLQRFQSFCMRCIPLL